jgi:predicted MFS family arabinose efflux permease
MMGGIIFVLASFVGGFVSSAGAGLYTFVSTFLLDKIRLTAPEIAFLLVGVAGVGLIISDLWNSQRPPNRKKI